MGGLGSGRWIAASILVVGAILGVVLATRGCAEDDAPPSASAPPRRSTSAATQATSTSPTTDAPATKPLRRHPNAPETAVDPASETGGRVVVRVTRSEDGAPIADALVAVPYFEDARRTDSDGIARYGPLEPGEWEFEATAPARMQASAKCVVEARREKTVEMRLDPGADVWIRVEDRRTGAPIAGAKVARAVSGSDERVELTTAADGRCLVPTPPNSVFRATVSAGGYTSSEVMSRTDAHGSPPMQIVVRLASYGRLTGIVRSSDGAAKSGAHVCVATLGRSPLALATYGRGLQAEGPLDETTLEAVILCDATGRYAVERIPRGRRFQAAAVADGFAASPVAEFAFDDDAPEFVRDFTLPAPVPVTLRLLAPDGTPAKDARLVLKWPVRSTSVEWGVRPSPTATYPIQLDAAGPMELVVIRQKSFMSLHRIDVPPGGGTFDVVVEPTSNAAVAGVVVDEAGAPVAGATVRIAPKSARSNMGTVARADADGVFHGAAFEPGPATYTAWGPGAIATERPIEFAAPCADLRVVLRRGACISLRLVENGAAVQGANFRAFLDDDPRELRCESAAPFRFTCEPRGDADLRLVFYDGHAPIVRRVRLVAGTVDDLGELALANGRSLRVRVVDAAGRPVPGAAVVPDVGDRPPTGVPLTDAQGEIVEDIAPPSGGLPLLVVASGYADLRRTFTVEGDAPLVVRLTRGGVIWGEVSDAAGVSATDAMLHLVDSRGVEVTSPTANRFGNFDVRVVAGRYVVRADGCDDVAVELADGGDAHVRMTRR